MDGIFLLQKFMQGGQNLAAAVRCSVPAAVASPRQEVGEGIDLGGCFDIFALDGTADGGRVDAHLLGQHISRQGVQGLAFG